MTTFPLGRRIEHDPRSRLFPVARRAVPLRTVLWRTGAPVLNQGDRGSCTGHAAAQAMNTTGFVEARRRARGNHRYLLDGDAVALYSRATELDQFPGTYPPTDTGSSGIGVAKALQERGFIREYRWSFGFDEFLAGMMSGPMLVGTWWHDAMFTPAGPEAVVTPVGPKVGGHEYLALGVDLRNRDITFLNSWGSAWGDRGRFRMGFTDFEALLHDQGDAVQPVL